MNSSDEGLKMSLELNDQNSQPSDISFNLSSRYNTNASSECPFILTLDKVKNQKTNLDVSKSIY